MYVSVSVCIVYLCVCFRVDVSLRLFKYICSCILELIITPLLPSFFYVQITVTDIKSIWAVVTGNGGCCQVKLNSSVTHLVTTTSEGVSGFKS